ncbi:MAG: ATP-binding protein [bacterium]|nr:ATP-binding protein [bacterium]
MPPHLAGRADNIAEMGRAFEQATVLQNVVLTGLRGVGKTVLLETIKPLAVARGWLWVGADLSESASLTEKNLAVRILTDLSLATNTWALSGTERTRHIGFDAVRNDGPLTLTYEVLAAIYDRTPGLVSDKLKVVLGVVASCLDRSAKRGIVFAYDEAQNLADHAESGEYPLSLLLEVFQSLQRMQHPFVLVLTGLPTLFPKLVEARTYAERMFSVTFLRNLGDQAAREAITVPIDEQGCPVRLSPESVDTIVRSSGGYPYFIQFICKEVYDAFIQQYGSGTITSVSMSTIERKLDSDFFAGRWARVTDRQRDLMSAIASLDHCDGEFSAQEIVAASRTGHLKPFSSSHVTQMLAGLGAAGLVFKNRHGRYSFAVPLMGAFIRRQLGAGTA